MNLRAVCLALTRNAAGKQVYLEMYQIILVLAWRMSFLYENGKTSILITWWEIISATQGQMSLCIVGTIRGYHRWVDGPLREWWTRFSKKMTWSLFLWCVRIFLQNRHITQKKTRKIFLQLVYIFFGKVLGGKVGIRKVHVKNYKIFKTSAKYSEKKYQITVVFG